jgi:hypothetical protein
MTITTTTGTKRSHCSARHIWLYENPIFLFPNPLPLHAALIAQHCTALLHCTAELHSTKLHCTAALLPADSTAALIAPLMRNSKVSELLKEFPSLHTTSYGSSSFCLKNVQL